MSAINATAANTKTDLLAQLNGATGDKKTNDLETPFLKVLTAQMKNQDPLNPTDNAELTSQLAQISTVDGINKMQVSMESLSSLFSSNQTLQAAGLLGREVMAEGSSLTLSGGEALGGMNLASAADRVTLTIYNADGTAVATQELGKLASGYSAFAWDGQNAAGESLPDGRYSYGISASNNGTAVEATRYAMATVASVVANASGMKLQLADGSSRELSQIQAFF